MPTPTVVQRHLPIGAEILDGRGVHFRVWAPRRTDVEVVFEEGRSLTLEPETEGYFSGFDELATSGTLYRLRLDQSRQLLPDPASRFQPSGPHGPSQVVDARAFKWTDDRWGGVQLQGQVIYEMHIGTFTRDESWGSASKHLAELAELGITLLEVMPVAGFPGSFGWGYDGVNLFAPTQLYGSPDDFRAFVNHAHSLELGVILDVVYNHLGPEGNYFEEYSHHYFTDRYTNEWGKAINFDGPGSGPVRELFISNARYWIAEFHLDGLRLDATQQIFDASPRNIIADIATEARKAAGTRRIVLIGENEAQDASLARPQEEGGCGLDGLWNDDFHHATRVALTGRNEAYYSDYLGTVQELISSTKWGYLYQGQRYTWQNKKRGKAAFDLKPASFITYIQNHDQISNSATGERIHKLASPARLRALTALMMLGPGTPMLFQGQEFGASAPFVYFADVDPTLAPLVQTGRAEFLSQFQSIAQSKVPIPIVGDRATFESCKLDHSERAENTNIVALYRDLLHLRRTDPVFKAQRADWMHGAVLGTYAFALRFFGGSRGDRLLIVNLSRNRHLSPVPEPLLAPPHDNRWITIWFSEMPQYGGHGLETIDECGDWFLTGESAVVLASEAQK